MRGGVNRRRLSALGSLLAVATSLGAQQSVLMPDSMLVAVPESSLVESGRARVGASGGVLVPTVLLHVSVQGSIQSARLVTQSSVAGLTFEYVVAGLEKPLLEEIAQVAQSELVGRLRRAGLSVSTYDSVADNSIVRGLRRLAADTSYGAPVVRGDEGRTVYAIAAPADTQTFSLDAGGRAGLIRLAKTLGTTIMIPELWFNAPQLQRTASMSHGFLLTRMSSGASIAGSMELNRASLFVVTPAGDTGSIALSTPLTGLSDDVGELSPARADSGAERTARSATAVRVPGDAGIVVPGIRRDRTATTEYELVVAPGRYSRAMLRGAASFFQGVAATVPR